MSDRTEARLVTRLVFARSRLRDLAAAKLNETHHTVDAYESELAIHRDRFQDRCRRKLRTAPNARTLWVIEAESEAQRRWATAREQELARLKEQQIGERRALIRASSQLRTAERVRDRLYAERARKTARNEQSASDDRSSVQRALGRRGSE